MSKDLALLTLLSSNCILINSLLRFGCYIFLNYLVKDSVMSIAPCVLLVKLPYKNSYYDFYVNLPAALGILSEVLLSHDIAHDIYDMQLNESAEDFYQRVESLQPKIIGFSMLTFRYLDNYKFYL